jgi:hypothetical protein
MACAFRVATAGVALPPVAVTATTSNSGANNAMHKAIASSIPGSTSKMTFLLMGASLDVILRYAGF